MYFENKYILPGWKEVGSTYSSTMREYERRISTSQNPIGMLHSMYPKRGYTREQIAQILLVQNVALRLMVEAPLDMEEVANYDFITFQLVLSELNMSIVYPARQRFNYWLHLGHRLLNNAEFWERIVRDNAIRYRYPY